MAFPHAKPGKDKCRNKDIPSSRGVLWNPFEGTIDIAGDWNGQDEVNPAKNRPRAWSVHSFCFALPFITISGPLEAASRAFARRGPLQHAPFSVAGVECRTALRTPRLAVASPQTSSPFHRRNGRWEFR